MDIVQIDGLTRKPLTPWQTFSSAPHRMMFFGGVIQGVAALAWWMADLLGRFGGYYKPISWSLPGAPVHAFLMIYGFFPFFIFGFLFTTFPRWMNGKLVSRQSYIPTFLLMFSGVLIFYLGLLTARPLTIIGAMLFSSGWGIGIFTLLYLLFTTNHPDKRHPVIVSAVVLAGWLGTITFLLWLITENVFFLTLSIVGGIWFFLLPTFLSVSHQMIPFFTSVVVEKFQFVRRFRVLNAMMACFLAHGLLELARLRSFLWIPDFILFLFALRLSWQWGPLQSFKNRLLAMLHISFSWLVIALFLYFLQSFFLFISDNQTFLFSLAPLHALVIGYFSGMVLGMATRVTLGHSGRPLGADTVTWVLFLAFQTVAGSRILADILTNAGINGTFWYLIAGGIWLATFTPWALKYGPIYLKERADKNPG
ncbi:MAG TPA: NnrS family protein [Nitrospiria bacterium]|nr:NnrS family protein [Nitrospiria bacterium]